MLNQPSFVLTDSKGSTGNINSWFLSTKFNKDVFFLSCSAFIPLYNTMSSPSNLLLMSILTSTYLANDHSAFLGPFGHWRPFFKCQGNSIILSFRPIIVTITYCVYVYNDHQLALLHHHKHLDLLSSCGPTFIDDASHRWSLISKVFYILSMDLSFLNCGWFMFFTMCKRLHISEPIKGGWRQANLKKKQKQKN